MPTINLDNVQAGYRRSNFTLGPINAKFRPGITSIVGINGAGKSTLCNALIGAVPILSGSTDFGGLRALNDVGFLPQAPVFPKNATCADVLVFASWLNKMKNPHNRITAVLDQLGLSEHANKKTSQLSGGMLRRLGIAQAIIHDPAVVLLDEPTAGLDPIQRIAVREAITENLNGKIVLVSTHLVEDIRAISDQIVVLNEGKLVFHGNGQELEQHDDPTISGESVFERALAHLFASQG